MKKLDFVLQFFGFNFIGVLLIYSTFMEDGIWLLYLAMFFLGFYHICHYFLHLAYNFGMRIKCGEYMAWYPLMVLAYFVFWIITRENLDSIFYTLLMAVIALTIGGYYFHAVHKETFDSGLKLKL